MANYTRDPAFVALTLGVDQIIIELGRQDVPDARAIIARYAGENNLQGHATGLVPVALWFARAHQQHLRLIRSATHFDHNMGHSSPEALDRALWYPIQQDFIAAVNRHGNDIVTTQGDTRTPHRVDAIVETYLPVSWGGRHNTGGAGGTVIKRTLKILAHTLLV